MLVQLPGNLIPGMYFLEIVVDGQPTTQMLMIQ